MTVVTLTGNAMTKIKYIYQIQFKYCSTIVCQITTCECNIEATNWVIFYFKLFHWNTLISLTHRAAKSALSLHVTPMQTNLSAQFVSVHSLSSTSLLIVLILTMLATNISLLPLWRNYPELQTYITSLILQKKLIFTASYDVYKHFIVVI